MNKASIKEVQSVKSVLNVYKPIGLTPLQTIRKIKIKFPNYKNEKISYAGRLDPMAEGVLILLVGQKNKEAPSYLNLGKEYLFESIFGIETDTCDILGILKRLKVKPMPKGAKLELTKIAKKYKGLIKQVYPPYSSYRMHGKPLFYWARRGLLAGKYLPTKEVEIKSMKMLNDYEIDAQELEKDILHHVNIVEGDFRQEKIKKRWKNFFASNKAKSFLVFRFQIICSSGTYVRSIVHELGKDLGVGAMTYKIKRTKVGKYRIENSINI
jgi:tRNA pseudouridine55 synthase